MKRNVIKRLTEREHYLIRPDTYIGGIESKSMEFLILENGKFEYQTVEYVPGLLKIIEEIFDNSIDEAIRTEFQFANQITVTFNKHSIVIKDNGRGVPQDPLDDGSLMAVVAFTEPRAGTNFEEDTKADGSIGRNGIGSFATNVFSTKFKVITEDGTNRLEIECENNLESFDFKQSKSSKHGTIVEFFPDLKRFGCSEEDGIAPVYAKLISQRMVHLTQMFPIKFTLVDNLNDLF